MTTESNQTTITCGHGDRDVVEIDDNKGLRKVIDLSGAPMVAYEKVTGKKKFPGRNSGILFEPDHSTGPLRRGGAFALYLPRHRKPFYRGLIVRNPVTR